jgi:N6-L-threonylcarbamoyladenine synthase
MAAYAEGPPADGPALRRRRRGGGQSGGPLATGAGLRQAHGFSFHAPPLKYCTDNAAMIALAGAERLALGLVDGIDAPARPRWPLDAAAASANPTHVPGRKGAKA